MAAKKIDPNPPRGERAGFIKVTTSLSPEIVELVNKESIRRKVAKETNTDTSAIIREALVAYLMKN